MKEIKAIINAYDQLDKTGARAALATVVRVEGSSYRRMGARMLITDEGIWTGGISGGCLEGDALKRARFAIAKAESSLVTYDTTQEDAYQIGAGLGCNGIIDVLFIPLDFSDPHNPVEVLKACLHKKRQVNWLLNITATTGKWPRIATGNIIDYQGRESLSIFEDPIFEGSLHEKIAQLTKSQQSGFFQMETVDGRSIAFFLEFLPPEIQLVLMGQQYDILPLARLAKDAGFRVIVMANTLKIDPKLFITADAVIEPHLFDETSVDLYTALVLMAHDYKTDKANLPLALKTSAPYIGILGPKKRSARMFNELEEQGYSIDQHKLERIFSPAGLDIGAASPEEIALSIVAEVKAVLSNREGGFLKQRQATIHDHQQECV